jgi:hypothetical protein
MVYFSSTALRGAVYCPTTRVLGIQFTSGPKIYDYLGVPQGIYDGLLAASSKGRYFDHYIRDHYSVR